MARDEVAIEALTERERFFEVDEGAGTVKPGGHAAGLRRDIGRETLAHQRGHGQACTLDANRVADGDVGQIEGIGFDFQGVEAHNLPHRLHDPREHGAEGSAKARSNR